MATITVSSSLDVAEKYDILVKQSLGVDSVYIRAKETVQEFFKDGAINESQKAEVISNIVGSIVNGITGASMNAAVEWARIEKQIELDKLKLAWEIDILENDSLLKAAQVDKMIADTRLAKIESKRLYGTAVFDANDNIISLADEGKVWTDMLQTEAATSKIVKEEDLIDQKIRESYAAIHKIVADAYVNHGSYSFVLSDSGLSSVETTYTNFTTLSDVQRTIGEEQAKGYTYNAWANALTGTSSMLGTAIAAEYADFSQGSTGGDLLTIIKDTAAKLNNTTVAT